MTTPRRPEDRPALPAADDAAAAGRDAARLGEALRRRGWRLASAESCTGGLIAAACTALAGSSDWFERGWVTYSDAAKTESLGVPVALIEAHGAVSGPVACAMAAGALTRSQAQLAVAVTGIAGPGGAVPGKPVGTVWLALAGTGSMPRAERLQLAGDRAAVRAETVRIALQRLVARAEGD
jgi:nicotinamide-nucleotide amidase